VIAVVCLNPAIDVTFQVDRLRPGASHRVRHTIQRAGGKGINVARVLHQLGVPVVLTGLVGGRRGEAITAELSAVGVTPQLIEVAAETRRTVTVVDGPAGATVFNEPGPPIGTVEWSHFVAAFESVAAAADAVVLTGSLPPGVPPDAYAQLTGRAHACGVPVLLDAEGIPLRSALPARPDLVKPNEHEAAPFATGYATALDGLLEAGARNAIVSLGADGLLAAVDDRRYRVRLDEDVAGNPTGAGDALAAVLARGMIGTPEWELTLREAVAVAGAAVAVPHAGEYDADTADRLRPLVRVQEV
jgi:tagatose 6-phosphate kinase